MMQDRATLLRAVMIASGLGALAIGWRLWPHAPNVAPVAALALFVAWATGRVWLGALMTLVVMLATDLMLGLYDLRLQAVVWGALMLPALFARFLPRGVLRAAPWSLLASLAASLSFFLLTNAAVWAFGTTYAPGPDGLLASLIAGLPFWRMTLAGDLFWTAVLFGGAALTTLGRRAHAARAPANT